jgi:uncharacterized protein
MTLLLNETFSAATLSAPLQWFCPPQSWDILPDGKGLAVTPDAATDFWQRTHYGFQADNGHFLQMPVTGDFRVETLVSFEGRHQYDQAGLLVRVDADNWLKTSVEFEPDEPDRLGAVVTRNGYSDWSTTQVAPGTTQSWLRITRHGSTFLVEAALTDGGWSQIRLAHLEAGQQMQAGLYACSPKGRGFVARFAYLRIETLST